MNFRSTFCLICGILMLASCEQMAYTCAPKSVDETVIEYAQTPEAWYSCRNDDPLSADGYSFSTKNFYSWTQEGIQLGWWKAYARHKPKQFVMEARGDTLIIAKNYRWDGMSLGTTYLFDLEGSLVHDALYDALQSGAPVKRSEADRFFYLLQKKKEASLSLPDYWVVRAIGGIYNDKYAQQNLIIVPIQDT